MQPLPIIGPPRSSPRYRRSSRHASLHDVELDNGELLVAPPGRLKSRVSASTARSMFDAADVVDGTHPFAVVGLGVVTISSSVTATTPPGLGAESTTIPSAGSGTANAGTEASSSTTGAPAKPTTATTSLPPTSSTTTSTTSPGTAATSTTAVTAPETTPLPGYVDRLAWVGIAWGAPCPVQPGASRLPTRYIAVVFDAVTGHSVLAYTSRGAASCGGPVEPTSVDRPSELVSVPWQPVGPSSTAVRVHDARVQHLLRLDRRPRRQHDLGSGRGEDTF